MRWTEDQGQAQRRETARRIADAARASFYEHGFNETSVDQIARAAGVSRATLYLHFPNKDAIVLALLSADLRAVRAIFRQLCALQKIDLASLRSWLETYIDTLRAHADAMQLFHIGLANGQQTRVLVADHHEAIVAELFEHFRLYDKSNVDAHRHAAARLVLARIDHFARAAADGEQHIDLKAGLDIVSAELLALLKSGGGKPNAKR